MSDVELRIVSLRRPAAHAVAHGPNAFLNLGILDLALPPDGVLIAIHANRAWDPDEAANWPEGPQTPKDAKEGLLGVGLVTQVHYVPALREAGVDLDAWAVGPWAIQLSDFVVFDPPADLAGGVGAGFQKLGGPLEDRIIRVWEEERRKP